MNKSIQQGMTAYAHAELNNSVVALEVRMFHAFKHLFSSTPACMEAVEETLITALAPYSLSTMLSFDDEDDADRYHTLAEHYGSRMNWPKEHQEAFDAIEHFFYTQTQEQDWYTDTAQQEYERIEMQAIARSM